MSILRRIGLAILSPLFVFILFATAFDVGFTHTVTDPAKIKRLAAESGVYDNLAPSLLKQQGSISTPFGDISTSNPDVQKAVDSAVSPQYVRRNVEAAIDNVYQWLNGDISRPDFQIGLAGDKQNIADSVSETIRQKLDGLPACSITQDLAIARSGQFDAASASCLPYGVPPAAVAAAAKTAVLTDPSLLSGANIKASDIKNGSGRSIFEQSVVRNIPKQYQRLKKTLWVLGILTILVAAGIVLLSRSRLAGLRHIGTNLAVAGLVMLILSWALGRAVSTDIVPKIKIDNAVLQNDLRALITDIVQQIDKNYWFFGGLYLILGAAAIGCWLFYRRKNRSRPLSSTPPN